MARVTNWWQRPQLHREEEEHKERKVSWLDLFLDLVFVVLIAELAHYIDEVSWQSIGGFVLLFVPCWWVWIGHTIYTDRFEQEDVSHRIYVFTSMLGLVALALNIHYGTDKTAVGFALSYAFMRLIIITMWFRGGLNNPAFRPVSNIYVTFFSVSVLLWVASIFVPAPLKFVMWGIGLLCDLFAPIPTVKHQNKLPRLSSSRTPERLGLFVIIVLGEAIVSIVSGSSDLKEITFYNVIVNGLAIAMAFSFWWIYFDQIQPLRPKPKSVYWSLLWTYSHLPVFVGITAVSTAMLKFITYEGKPLPDEVRWFMCGSFALIYLALILIELSTSKLAWRSPVFLYLRVITVLGALLVGLIGAGWNNILILTILMSLGLVQMVYGAVLWFRAGIVQSNSPL